MKKALIAMIAGFLAMSAQAAQINWGATGQIKFADGLVGNEGTTLQLVALFDVTEDWSTYAGKVANGTATDYVVAEKKTNAGSAALPQTSPYTFNFGDENSIAEKTYNVGEKFAFIAMTTQDGQDYYWASDVYEVKDSGDNWNGTSKTYTMSVTASTTINTGWKSTPAVPEPSVALMGLLGLGMLLNRRKA